MCLNADMVGGEVAQRNRLSYDVSYSGSIITGMPSVSMLMEVIRFLQRR